MKKQSILLMALSLLLLSACQQKPVCPAGSITYGTVPAEFPEQGFVGPAPTPALVQIGGKTKQVDRVIQGPVCNDRWSGVIYVSCDVQIPAWDQAGKPTFFQDCDLGIAADTTVYVAAHNDAAYYNGCSCHTRTEQ